MREEDGTRRRDEYCQEKWDVRVMKVGRKECEARTARWQQRLTRRSEE